MSNVKISGKGLARNWPNRYCLRCQSLPGKTEEDHEETRYVSGILAGHLQNSFLGVLRRSICSQLCTQNLSMEENCTVSRQPCGCWKYPFRFFFILESVSLHDFQL